MDVIDKMILGLKHRQKSEYIVRSAILVASAVREENTK